MSRRRAPIRQVPRVITIESQGVGDPSGETHVRLPAEHTFGFAEVTLEAADIDLGMAGGPGNERHVTGPTRCRDGDLSDVQEPDRVGMTEVENLPNSIGVEHPKAHCRDDVIDVHAVTQLLAIAVHRDGLATQCSAYEDRQKTQTISGEALSRSVHIG